jgi:transcriptional regulator with XRE-family HTH domain
MNTRLKLLRRHLNISQEAFGKRLGVTGAGISKIESGHRSLTDQMIILICKEFNINENWLRNGQGEIFKKKLSTGMEELVTYYQLDELDVKIIYEYLVLDDKKRKVIKDYIQRVASVDQNADILTDGERKKNVPKCAEELDMDGTMRGISHGKDMT